MRKTLFYSLVEWKSYTVKGKSEGSPNAEGKCVDRAFLSTQQNDVHRNTDPLATLHKFPSDMFVNQFPTKDAVNKK